MNEQNPNDQKPAAAGTPNSEQAKPAPDAQPVFDQAALDRAIGMAIKLAWENGVMKGTLMPAQIVGVLEAHKLNTMMIERDMVAQAAQAQKPRIYLPGDPRGGPQKRF